MRTHNHNGLIVNYPDEYCYAFNPVTIEVAGLMNGAKVTAIVAGATVSAYAWQGVAIFNIAPILQSLFNQRELSVLDLAGIATSSRTAKSVAVSVPSVELEFTTLCVWGALQVDLGVLLSGDFNYDFSTDFLSGPLKGDAQNLIWFTDMPFSISIPMMSGDTIWLKNKSKTIYTSSNTQIVNLSLPKLITQEVVVGEVILQLKSGSIVKREYHVLRRELPKSSMYLRWIDKKGYYNYWAFEKGSDDFEAQKSGVYINSYSRSIDYVDGFNGGDGRQQGKTAKRNIVIASPLADMSTWNFLLGITQSPIVDLYTDNDYLGKPRYIKVDVIANKIARESRDLADFVTTITLPEINNQQL